jgi:hypothetical protein
MNDFRRIISKIIEDEIRVFVASQRPETLFEQAFFDIRQKVKTMKSDLEGNAKTALESRLKQDLTSKGVRIQEMKLSLGKYRGSAFVTSCRLKVPVKSEEEAQKMATYLRSKYSPKWKVKNFIDGIAELNVR